MFDLSSRWQEICPLQLRKYKKTPKTNAWFHVFVTVKMMFFKCVRSKNMLPFLKLGFGVAHLTPKRNNDCSFVFVVYLTTLSQ
jgi:hypothetical protein